MRRFLSWLLAAINSPSVDLPLGLRLVLHSPRVRLTRSGTVVTAYLSGRVGLVDAESSFVALKSVELFERHATVRLGDTELTLSHDAVREVWEALAAAMGDGLAVSWSTTLRLPDMLAVDLIEYTGGGAVLEFIEGQPTLDLIGPWDKHVTRVRLSESRAVIYFRKGATHEIEF